MKKLQRIKAFLAIAAMFLMTTTVFAQHITTAFTILSPTGGNHAGRQLGSFVVGSGETTWTAGTDSIFFDRAVPTDIIPATVGNAAPGMQATGGATENDFDRATALLACVERPAGAVMRRPSAGTNLYTFRFTSTDVSELTLRFVNNLTTGGTTTRNIEQVRIGADRTNLTTLVAGTGFTLVGNPFNPIGATHADFACNVGVVTIAGLSVPAGHYIEVVIGGGNTTFIQAVATYIPPTGDPSLALERIVVAETDLPEATFVGVGPFVYALQRTATVSPQATIYALTPNDVTITAARGIEGQQTPIASGDYFYIPMPAGVYTDTIVFRVTGTTGAIDGQTATYLVIFQKDTVDIRVANVVPANETAIPAAGNIVVTFNKPVFATVDLDEFVYINGEAVTVTLAGTVMTIPYTTADWIDGAMDVEILPGYLVDAVLEPFEGQIFNFTQDMSSPEILYIRAFGEVLDGANSLPTSIPVTLEFSRSDVERNPEVNITLGGEVIEVTGTSFLLSGLSYTTEYTLNIPAGAFRVPTNTALTSPAISATFETTVFRVVLAGYRPVAAGCSYRAFRRIVENEQGVRVWATGDDAYSGDRIWFYTGDPTVTPYDPTPITSLGAAGAVANDLTLYGYMLSPHRFADSPQTGCTFDDTGIAFAPQRMRMVTQAASQFVLRLESTSVSELSLNMFRGGWPGGSFPAGEWDTYIREIAYAEHNEYFLFDDNTIDFNANTVDVRGAANMAETGAFILTATNFDRDIPQGRYVRIRISRSTTLAEVVITPTQEAPIQDYLIESVTYNNAEGREIDGDQDAPLSFIASVNFERDDMVRNTTVNITLNNTAIEESTITGTTISFTDLAQTTNFELVFPEGAFMSSVNNALRSQAYTVNFRTAEDASILPGISAQAISIHPNPVSDVLYVTAENMQSIEIMDMLGRTVLKRTTTNSRESIDVTELREGLYFIRITKTNGEVAVMRFVKN